MPQSIALPVMAGISAVGGLLGGMPKTTTTTNTPSYTPDQMSMQHNLSDMLSARMAHPEGVFDPMKAAAINGVNQTYAGIGQRMQSQFSGRGFGRSGTLLTNRVGQEVSRAGDIGGLESQFASKQLDYTNNLMDQASRFGFANPGSRATSTSPNTMAAGAFGAGSQTLTSLWALNKLMGGGSLFGGGAGGGGGGSIHPDGTPSWQPGGPT